MHTYHPLFSIICMHLFVTCRSCPSYKTDMACYEKDPSVETFPCSLWPIGNISVSERTISHCHPTEGHTLCAAFLYTAK